MYKPLYVLAAVASLAVVQTPAQALQLPGAGTVNAILAGESGIQQAAFIYGRHSYCFYRSGWHGPGWYRCGFAFRRGLGWGGVYGWNSWTYPGVGLAYRHRGNWDRRHVGHQGNGNGHNWSNRRGGGSYTAAPSHGRVGANGSGTFRGRSGGSYTGHAAAQGGGSMNRGAAARPSGGGRAAVGGGGSYTGGGGAGPAAGGGGGGGAAASGGGAPAGGGGGGSYSGGGGGGGGGGHKGG